MDLKIRKVELGDVVVITATERLIAETPGFLVSAPDEIQDSVFLETIQRAQTDPSLYYRLGLNQLTPVGHILLHPLSLRARAHVVTLNLVVHPEHQGKGYGRALLGDGIWWAKNSPAIEKIELRVRSSNTKAIGLYQSVGFKEEGRLIRELKLPDGTYRDEIVMSLAV